MPRFTPVEIQDDQIHMTLLHTGIAHQIINQVKKQSETEIRLIDCHFWIRVTNMLRGHIVEIVIRYPNPQAPRKNQYKTATYPIHLNPRFCKLAVSDNDYQQLMRLIPLNLRPQSAFTLPDPKEEIT